MASQVPEEGKTFELPLLALCYRRPSEGLPLLQDWVSNARDIFSHGYERHRESIEVRHSSDMWPEVVDYGSVIPVKGLGKISMLLFGLVFTYVNMRDSLTEAELGDFLRLAGTKGSPLDILQTQSCQGDGFTETVASGNTYHPLNELSGERIPSICRVVGYLDGLTTSSSGHQSNQSMG